MPRFFRRDAGLIVADAFGATIVCEAPEHRLAAATRKTVMLRFAHAAALRLQALADPQGPYAGRVLSYFGARLARMRCKVRRCMLRRRAVSETLRPHNS